MNRLLLLLFMFVLFVSLISCGSRRAGTVDSTETGISANVYQKDGAPASGALVAAYDVHSTSGSAIATTFTDDSGRFNFDDSILNSGQYNIIATLDTLGVMFDSVILIEDTLEELEDTLRFLGQVSGYVGVQPQHSPQIVTIHVSGSDVININVDPDGYFALPEMVPGTYNVEFRPNGTYSGEYSPTYETITVTEGVRDTLADTVHMIFTGIPIVTNMALVYDTTYGKVTISWDKNDYDTAFLQAYIIERKDSADASWPATPIGISYVTSSVHDTTFEDYPFAEDTTSDSLVLHYRVRIRDEMGNDGPPFNYVQITVPNPKSVAITSNITTDFTLNTASINDTISLFLHATNPTRNIDSALWTIDGETIVVSGRDTTELLDTQTVSFTSMGIKNIFCALYDDHGIITNDTIELTILQDPPVIHSVRDSITRSTDTVSIVATDSFGAITSYSWDFGLTGNAISSDTVPHIFVSSNELFIDKPLAIKVTDDDDNVVEDTVLITYRPDWEEITTSANLSQLSSVFAVGNTILMFDSSGIPSVSSDGTTWESTEQAAPFDVVNQWFTVLEFNGTIWALSAPDSAPATLWNTTDLITWTKVDSTHTLALSDSDQPPLLFTYNNQLHTNITNDTLGDFQSTTDGTNWVNSQNSFPLTINEYASLTTTESGLFLFTHDELSNDISMLQLDRYFYPTDTTVVASNSGYANRHKWRFFLLDNHLLGNIDTTLYYSNTAKNQFERLTETPKSSFVGIRMVLFQKNFWYFDTDGTLWRNR